MSVRDGWVKQILDRVGAGRTPVDSSAEVEEMDADDLDDMARFIARARRRSKSQKLSTRRDRLDGAEGESSSRTPAARPRRGRGSPAA